MHGKKLVPPKATATLGEVQRHAVEVAKYLPQDTVNNVDFHVSGATYPLAYQLHLIQAELKDISMVLFTIVFAASVRCINIGGLGFPRVYNMARLAGRRLKTRKDGSNIKIAREHPRWEDLGVHRALDASQARIHELTNRLDYLRKFKGLGELPPRIYSEVLSFERLGMWRTRASLAIPKVTRGTTPAWFQHKPNQERKNWQIGKNVLEVFPTNAGHDLPQMMKGRDKLRIKWYHVENDDPTGARYRIYTSRKSWEESHNSRDILRKMGIPVPIRIFRHMSPPEEDETKSEQLQSFRIQRVPTNPQVRITYHLSHDQPRFELEGRDQQKPEQIPTERPADELEGRDQQKQTPTERPADTGSPPRMHVHYRSSIVSSIPADMVNSLTRRSQRSNSTVRYYSTTTRIVSRRKPIPAQYIVVTNSDKLGKHFKAPRRKAQSKRSPPQEGFRIQSLARRVCKQTGPFRE